MDSPTRIADNASNQIDLLYERSYDLVRTDPAEALRVARKAEKLARKAKDASGVARSLERVSVALRSTSDFPAAQAALEEAQEIYLGLNDQRGLAKCRNILGGLHYAKGDFTRAILAYREGAFMSRESGFDQYEADALYVIGLAFFHLGNYTEAYNHYQRALEIGERIDSSETKAIVYRCLGVLFVETGDPQRAVRYLQSALELSEDDLFNRCSILNALGEVHSGQANFREALGYLTGALKLSRKIRGKIWEAQTENAIAAVYLESQDVQRAREHFERALNLSNEHGFNTIGERAEIGLAKIALDEHDPKMARALLAKALARDRGAIAERVSIHALMSRAYKLEGNSKKALEHMEHFAEAREEQRSNEKQRILADMEARIEIARHEKELREAEERARTLEHEVHKRNSELMALALQAVQKKEFLESLKTSLQKASNKKVLVRRIDEQLRNQDDWVRFELEFNQVHGPFIVELTLRFPTLTQVQAGVCAMLRLNLPSKTIASILNISVRTVEWHRNEIRKKLKLAPDVNLGLYFAQLIKTGLKPVAGP